MTAPPASPKTLRQQRLAAALRANLKRRKAAAKDSRPADKPVATVRGRDDDAPRRA